MPWITPCQMELLLLVELGEHLNVWWLQKDQRSTLLWQLTASHFSGSKLVYLSIFQSCIKIVFCYKWSILLGFWPWVLNWTFKSLWIGHRFISIERQLTLWTLNLLIKRFLEKKQFLIFLYCVIHLNWAYKVVKKLVRLV